MNRVFGSPMSEWPTRWLGLAVVAVLTSSCATEGTLEPIPGFVASRAGGAAGIHGNGSTGPGGYDLTMSAHLTGNGSAHGSSTLVGGATGSVVQVVPPSGMRDFWCVTVQRTDVDPSLNALINWYIRDAGDGKTTFDQISFVSSLGGDCTTYPDALGSYLALTSGDFKGHL